MRHLPNLICLARMALIWPIVASLVAGEFRVTLLWFVVAAFSDGLDGWLAKRFGWTSRLGRVLDPVADKLLLVSVFLVLTWLGRVPQWLTVLAVTRDFTIGIGALTYRICWGPLNGRPIASSKVNTLLQILYVCLVVLQEAYGMPPAGVVRAMAVASGVMVVVSGFAYVREFTRRALLVAAHG
jgi:cardiolipin synthase